MRRTKTLSLKFGEVIELCLLSWGRYVDVQTAGVLHFLKSTESHFVQIYINIYGYEISTIQPEVIFVSLRSPRLFIRLRLSQVACRVDHLKWIT